MVQKFGKFGVRSGNSLKASNSKYLRRYRREALIFRESINCSDETLPVGVIEQTDVTEDEVPYSLNKRGRWSLPESIKRAILSGEFRREEYGVQMVEVHKVNRPANCVAVYASKGPLGKLAIQKKKGKRHRRRTGYMQAKSIINAKSVGVSKRKQKQLERLGINPEGESSEEFNETSQIRFEVIYPSQVTSSVTHNPKYIGHDTSIRKQKNGVKKRRRKHYEHFLYEDSLDMDAQLEESEDEDCYHDDEYVKRNYLFLSDFIKQPRKTRRKRGQRELTFKDTESSAFTRKQNIFYNCANTVEEPSDSIKEEDNALPSSNENSGCLSVSPVLVFLKADEVQPNLLKHNYGSNYVECSCSPRKFIIDISERAKNSKMFQNRWKLCPGGINATVTFVLDAFNECNSVTEQVYKVYLNAPLDNQIESIKIETLFDYMETTVNECLTRVLFFMETVAEHIEISKSHTIYGKTRSCLSDSKSVSYDPNDRFVFKILFDKPQNLPNHMQNEHNHYTVVLNQAVVQDDIFCGICYDVVSLHDSSSTALNSCRHWFCDRCWNDYLRTAIRNGAICLECPEFDCDTPVDPGTLLTLVNIKDAIRYARSCHDTKVEQQTATKWCPNERCGRIIQAYTERPETVSCDCGQNWCFKCDGKKHWPATCIDAKSYHTKLREMGLEEIKSEEPGITSVNGRNCPFCKRFVEKNGGCPYMYCVCRNAFCWGCGKPYNSFSHIECSSKGSRNVHGGTIKKRLVANPSKLEDYNTDTVRQLFDIAVSHRFEQGRERIKEMKLASKKLSKRLQVHILRLKEKDERLVIDIDEIHHRAFTSANDFLLHMISLYSEINNLAEYTAVLLLSSTVSKREMVKFLKHILNRFKLLSSTIHNTIVENHDCQPREILVRLKDARFHSVKGIKALRSKLKKVRL